MVAIIYTASQAQANNGANPTNKKGSITGLTRVGDRTRNRLHSMSLHEREGFIPNTKLKYRARKRKLTRPKEEEAKSGLCFLSVGSSSKASCTSK